MVETVDADALIADLDPDQRAAVTSPSHLVAVIAGAGSGKTRVLTRRIAYRIEQGTADARHTLALTFTREAAGELRKRLSRLGIRERVEAGTFHSVMLAVLKQRWTDTNRRALTVQPDRRRVVGDVLAGNRRGIESFLDEINWAAARGVNAAGYAQAARRSHRKPQPGVERCSEVFTSYESLKRKRGIIDFDDVLAHVIRDLERDPDFAAATRWRFRHLLVDEAQDLNPLQHRLVDLLRDGRDDLFIVGDPSQAVYGFNGADPTLLIDVEERFPGVEIIRLPVNHRSTPQVVSAGVQVLDASGQPAALRSFRGDGPAVTHHVADDETAEARRVANEIMHADPNLVRSGEVAILTRTNAQLATFEDELARVGIGVRRSATAAGTPLQAAVRRASMLSSSAQLRAWAHDTLDEIESLKSAQAEADMFADQTNRRAAQHAAHAVRELEAERQVAAAALDYLRDQTLGDGAGFRAWVAMTNPFDDASTDGVHLLTFHASKGREWHTVFVTGIESSLMPHKSATTAPAKSEEARLLYVAITRATDRLTITHAERRGGYARTASPFLADLDLGDAQPAPLPSQLRRTRRLGDPLLLALKAWRADNARAAGVLPAQLCSDRDISSIARARPHTWEELEAATSFGMMTAKRLAPQIIALVTDAGDDDQSKSTITGA